MTTSQTESPHRCVVCLAPATVRDPDLPDNFYCSVDAASLLATFILMRRTSAVLAASA